MTSVPSPFAPLGVKDNDLDEIDVALLVDSMLTPTLDVVRVREELDSLAGRFSSDQAPWLGLQGLGFCGNEADYEAAHNSSLSWVLANRRGIPITLAVILMAVARQRGFQAVGINHPGHFLVQVDTDLIDPFAMTPYQRSAPESEPDSAAGFQVAAPRELALRMLNNLKYGHARTARWDQALQLIDHQLAIVPQAWELHFERGTLWEQLGGLSRAVEIYTGLLAEPSTSVPAPLREQAVKRLQMLGDRPTDTLH